MNPFETNIINLYQNKGQKWLNSLPKLVEMAAAEYGLSDLQPVSNLSYNYVLSGFQSSKPIILKLVLDNEKLKKEVLALKAFSGYGAVNVLIEKKECYSLNVLIREYP